MSTPAEQDETRAAYGGSGIRSILEDLIAGLIDTEEAVRRLTHTSPVDLGFAMLDPHRPLRSTLPEIVYAPGKTVEQLIRILREMHRTSGLGIASRVDVDRVDALSNALKDGTYHPLAKVFSIGGPLERTDISDSPVAVITAGTSDIPVAEEAAVVLELLGVTVKRFPDVGVAGIHRLAGVIEDIRSCAVCVVAAGMDAALPSVVGGLHTGPVIAVPTSVGYGASFGGVTALLSILNSCSPGIVTVNIDNGIGAAGAAMRVLSAGQEETELSPGDDSGREGRL